MQIQSPDSGIFHLILGAANDKTEVMKQSTIRQSTIFTRKLHAEIFKLKDVPQG